MVVNMAMCKNSERAFFDVRSVKIKFSPKSQITVKSENETKQNEKQGQLSFC